MKSIFSQVPFFRFFLPFVSGIIINVCFDLSRDVSWLLIAAYAVVLTVYFTIRFKSVGYKKILFAVLINVFFFLLGTEMAFLFKADNKQVHYTHFLSTQPAYTLAYVTELPQQKEKTVKAEVTILSLNINGKWQNAEGKLFCYVEKDTNAEKISYGNLLVFKSNPSEIAKPMNPNEFDYKEYLSRKNIFHQVYIKQNEWMNAGNYENNFLYAIANKLKSKLISILKSYDLKGEELAVVSALLLGYDDDINSDLLNAYAHTGTLHVLSVSGLHVGVIYIMLNFFFGFLDKNKKLRFLKCGIILIFLWFYALLSGLSPSVVRAAAMFSMMLIGITFRKKASIYNTIFVTAFFILLTNPFLILDVGFQLSYLAVLSIVYFQPRIYRLFEFNNYILDKTWALTAVSLAAQLGTLPLSLYYFHQFPTYFIISNLIIIPISTIIMYLGIIALFLSPFTLICKYIILALSVSVNFMNKLTLFFDSWPFSYIGNINISFLQLLLMYLLIGLLTLAIIQKSYRMMVSGLATCILVLLFSVVRDVSQLKQEQLCIYQVNKQTVIDIYKGDHALNISSDVNLQKQASFHVSGNRIIHNINTIDTRILRKGIAQLEWNDKKIVIINNCDLNKYKTEEAGKADLLIFSNNPKAKLNKAITSFEPEQLIVDGSNNYKSIKYWKKGAEDNALNIWFTKDSGAKVYSTQ